MIIEVWSPYPEFSFIQGSSLGRVRTIDRYIKTKNGKRLIKGHILKQWRNMGGYLKVKFNVNGKTVNLRVHRIVAECFIENPDNLPQVNHKDCNRTNNCVDNLEWCDNSYNMQYREEHGKAQGHPVLAISLSTLGVLRFPSQNEASRALGVYLGHLNAVIAGKRNKTGGYWFTKANSNAVETTRNKFGDEVADKVEKLMNGK